MSAAIAVNPRAALWRGLTFPTNTILPTNFFFAGTDTISAHVQKVTRGRIWKRAYSAKRWQRITCKNARVFLCTTRPFEGARLMQMHNDTLEKYRDAVMQVVHANNQSLLLEDRMSDKQKAGTALLMAAASVSFAAALVSKTEPHLKNAPMGAQIEDLLGLLRDTLIQKKPVLNVVNNEEDLK